ncbi:MAG: hypothetical protein ACRES9_10400 [Gammaproteobacteria bacterium]
MSVFWKFSGFVMLALSALVMSPILLVSGMGDAKRYFAMRKM